MLLNLSLDEIVATFQRDELRLTRNSYTTCTCDIILILLIVYDDWKIVYVDMLEKLSNLT